jgi:stearoyl-CoA desaturase (delta-9 desaturase)
MTAQILSPQETMADRADRESDTLVPISLVGKIIMVVALVIPFLGLVAAAVLLWGYGFSWVELGLLAGMYIVTVLGVGVGYHRLFTHRSFEAGRVVRFILAALGSMAVQGPLLRWVAVHRRHHQLSDAEGDPHSPHLHGGGFFGMLRGLWHAHLGWMFKGDVADSERYVKDLQQHTSLKVADALFPLWVSLGLLVPAILGGILTGSWMGFLLGLLWGGFARVFLVHHVTWSVNSICHMWGRKPFRSHDESRNNFLVGILALGEGWHNNHHAFPTSARHGMRWWQIDVSWWVIRVLAWCRLAWNVRVPSRQTLEAQMA